MNCLESMRESLVFPINSLSVVNIMKHIVHKVRIYMINTQPNGQLSHNLHNYNSGCPNNLRYHNILLHGDVFRLFQTESAMSNCSSSCFCFSKACNKIMASNQIMCTNVWIIDQQSLSSWRLQIEKWSHNNKKRLVVSLGRLLTVWFLVLRFVHFQSQSQNRISQWPKQQKMLICFTKKYMAYISFTVFHLKKWQQDNGIFSPSELWKYPEKGLP